MIYISFKNIDKDIFKYVNLIKRDISNIFIILNLKNN